MERWLCTENGMIRDPEGPWVRYDDVEGEVSALSSDLNEEIMHLEAQVRELQSHLDWYEQDMDLDRE